MLVGRHANANISSIAALGKLSNGILCLNHGALNQNLNKLWKIRNLKQGQTLQTHARKRGFMRGQVPSLAVKQPRLES
jgi:hypothetical protein